MGLLMNSYERKLVKRWHQYVTKHEAEEFLLDLRTELYGNPSARIRVNGRGEMPRLPKWAKNAFHGKLPYSEAELERWAKSKDMPVEAIKIFGKNHHFPNEFRKMCEAFTAEDKQRLVWGMYKEVLLGTSKRYEREPEIWFILSRCSDSQIKKLGEWAGEKYAN